MSDEEFYEEEGCYGPESAVGQAIEIKKQLEARKEHLKLLKEKKEIEEKEKEAATSSSKDEVHEEEKEAAASSEDMKKK